MYSEKIKKSIQKYREEHTESYNEYQRNYYHSKKVDSEWLEAFRNRCKEASKRYRAKKLEGAEPKPRGRPRSLLGKGSKSDLSKLGVVEEPINPTDMRSINI